MNRWPRRVRGTFLRVEESLFDLAADPAEQRNLLDARPADADRLPGLREAWEAETRAESRPRVLGAGN